MKKLFSFLIIGLLLCANVSMIEAAPSWQTYAEKLQSDQYLQLVASQSKKVAKDIIVAQPAPNTDQEIKIYNYAHDVLAAKWDSKIIYEIASFVTNEAYLTNLSDWQSIGEDIITALYTSCGNYTVFACIGKVY